MGQRGEVYSRSDHSWRFRVVDGNNAAAVGASTKMRRVILVQREVPQNDTLPPVACRFDNEICLSNKQVAFLPFAAGTFRKPDAFGGEMIVEFGLGVRAAAVTMCGSACGEFRRLGIAQNLVRKIHQIPVVVEGRD